jgi:hypothetical protein
MIKRISILSFLFFIFSCSEDDSASNTTPPVIEFNNEFQQQKTFGGSQEDDALAVVETQDGNIAVLGLTQSNDGDVTGKTTTDSDYWLLKLDTDFNLIWQKTFGGTSDDRGQDILVTQDGGFLVTGFSRSSDGDVSSNAGFHDFWVLKLNASGEIVWEKSIGFPGNDRSFSAIQTSDGGFFITGFLDVSASNGEGNDNDVAGRSKNILAKHGVGEFWGVKLNNEGETQWRRYFGGTNNDRSYDVIETDDDNLIMVGSSESNDFDVSDPKGSYDFWAVKVSLDGDMIWQKNFGGSSIDIGYSVTSTLDNQYLFVGDTRSSDGDVVDFKGNTDYWLVKFDESSNLIWQKTYGGTDFESARSVLQLQSGELLLTGSSRSADGQVSENFGQNDVWIVHTENNGTLKSEMNIGGSQIDFANDAIQLQSGEVIVVGSSESNDNDITENKGDKDLLILKLK